MMKREPYSLITSSNSPKRGSYGFTIDERGSASISPSPYDTGSDSQDGSEDHQTKENGMHSGTRSGACVHCKSLKVRCEFNPGERICHRCLAGGYECIPRTRKKRKAAPTHEDLQERSYSQDCQIQGLLSQLDRLKADRRFQSWAPENQAGLSQRNLPGSPRYGDNKSVDSLERAVTTNYPPDCNNPLPEIVKYLRLFPEDIRSLFQIYFDQINPHLSLLDPEIYTPRIMWRSPFLFTVICATASRFYSARSELYYAASEFALDAAGRALISGTKTIEVCQAFLILAAYPIPKRRWTDDRRWLFTGLAVRMVLELELDQSPMMQLCDRDSLNRTRTWLFSFCADAFYAITLGKPPMLRLDAFMMQQIERWCRNSSNLPGDIHLCARVRLLATMEEWRRQKLVQFQSSQNNHVQFSLIVSQRISEQLDYWLREISEALECEEPVQIRSFRNSSLEMLATYLRLIVLAEGMEHAAKAGLNRLKGSAIFRESIDAALGVIHLAVDRLHATGLMRYTAPVGFLYMTFAAAYLINMLTPPFANLVDQPLRETITTRVGGLLVVLGSKDVSVDNKHSPALSHRFLTSLLRKFDIKLPYPQQRASFRPDTISSIELHHLPLSSPTDSWQHPVPYAATGAEVLVPQSSLYDTGDGGPSLNFMHFVKLVNQEESDSMNRKLFYNGGELHVPNLTWIQRV